MPNKIDVDAWIENITAGMNYKEKYGDSKSWSTYTEYGRGNFGGYKHDTSLLPYNITYAMEKGLIPEVYFRNPYVTVSPRFGSGFDMQAKIVEAIDNWIINEIGLKDEIKLACRDAYYCGRGIIKVGYDGLGSDKKTANNGVNRKIADILGFPLSHTSKNGGERTEYNVNVKPNMPWAVRVAPEDFVVPFGVRTIKDCPWIDHISIKWLKDIKDSPLYTHTRNLDGTHLMMVLRDSNRNNYYQQLEQSNAKAKLVEVHEIRDFKRQQILALVPGYDDFIRGPYHDGLQIEGLPFCDFTFNEDRQFYWSPSDVKIMEPQQLEMNETNTQAMKHRRIALVKFLIEKGGMDPGEVDKMLSEEVGPAAFTNGNPENIVKVLQLHIPPDLPGWLDNVRGHVRELFGQSKQSLGEAPQGRRTKFEMQGVFAGREVRMDERRDAVADCLKDVIRKINQIIFTHWDANMVVPVIGLDGAKYWVQTSAKAARGEYNLSIDVESMTPKSKVGKRQEIAGLIQTLAKNPKANINYLMKMLVREFDYLDAMQILPDAPESAASPMSQGQFGEVQNQMLSNPGMLQERVNRTAGSLGEV